MAPSPRLEEFWIVPIIRFLSCPSDRDTATLHKFPGDHPPGNQQRGRSLTTAAKTWYCTSPLTESLTKGNSCIVITFERNVLWNKCGTSYNAELQTYETKKLQKLQELCTRPISYIRSKHLKWFGYDWRAVGQLVKEVSVYKIKRNDR